MPTTTSPRVVVLIDGAFPGTDHPDVRRVTREVTGADVFLVSPTRPVPGEDWIVDRTARDAQAGAHLAGWTSALRPHVHSVDGELGDPDPRWAIADARHAFPADRVVMTSPR